MVHECFTWLLLLQLFLLACSVCAKVPAMIVFGDSTVDSGNNNRISTSIKSNFGPYGRDFFGGKATGRFSNGRLIPMSERFGIKPTIPAYLDPAYGIEDFANGVTFASSGSGYDNSTSRVISVIPLWKELEYFKEYQVRLRKYVGDSRASAIINKALYTISMGTNDFLFNYFVLPNRPSQFTVEEYQYFILQIAENFILDIYRLGVRKIAITGLPPIGCLPTVRSGNWLSGRACREDYNKVARDYNVKLKKLIAKLTTCYEDIDLVILNIYDPIQKAIQKPHKYGLKIVDVGCCATGMFEFGPLCNSLSEHTCADASKYAFWDAVHPSEKLYQIIADRLMPDLVRFR